MAAVLAEPIAANMGVVPPADGFLEFLRAVSAEAGALLIFDEVITGFRVARGGAQELYGVQPDLTVLGKVLGGGLPAAAFAGRRELMERIAPAGDVYQAGTLSGNPLAIAAGLATLGELDAAAYERLAELTELFAAGLAELARDRPLQVASAPGLLTLFFSEAAVGEFAAARACDLEAHARFCRAMLKRGVYPPPSQFEAWFVSLAHDEEAIERTLQAAEEALRGGPRVSRPADALHLLAAQLPRRGHADLPLRGGAHRGAGLRPSHLGRPGSRPAPGEYALVVEAVREGYLLHYGEPRLLAGHDADLALLAGDYLYALGIERLSTLGDSDAVRELADLISLCAQLHSEGREDAAPDLWRASAAVLGEGPSDDHEAAKLALRSGQPHRSRSQ